MPDPNPIFDLGNPIWIQLVAIAETPAALAQFAGRYLPVPSGIGMPALGTRGVVIVSGVQIPGYLRQQNGQYEWVMMPPVDPIEAAVNALPGAPGWSDAGARQTWLSTAIYLRGLGVGLPDLAPGLQSLYDAERTNLLKAVRGRVTAVLGREMEQMEVVRR